MSILIKGMDYTPPRKPDKVYLVYYFDDDIGSFSHSICVTDKLIELPPHGRLIDADSEIGVNVTMMPGGKCKVDLIAPTVIPAEEDPSMNDYIRREEAVRQWCGLHCGCEPDECGHTLEQDGTEHCTMVDFLLEFPTADVRPVRWIPVSERLPDMNDYDWVLGVVSGKFGYTVFQNAVICVGYDPDFGFFLEEYPDVEITVTHWMPLPEAPEEVPGHE